jgi:tetratricopeptide (TPR) repeat protein
MRPVKRLRFLIATLACSAALIPHIALAQPSTQSFPGRVILEGIRHQWQTWNNCGPATISMALSYHGRPELQWQAAAYLKPNPDDKNVRPDELAEYVRSIGLRADNLYAGDLDRLKRLIAMGVPVLVSTWYWPPDDDGLGHYRLLTGYDDAAQLFYFYDSYVSPGVNLRMTYAAFDEDWRVYSRNYVPVYTPEQAPAVAAIVGEDLDDNILRQRMLAVAEDEATQRPGNAFSWFNLGTAQTRLGRTADAALSFDRARAIGLPTRLLWYQFAPLEAYLAENRFTDVLALADYTLQQVWEIEEQLYFRGKGLEGLGRRAEARAAFNASVNVNPKFTPALHALNVLGLSGDDRAG